MSEIQVGKFQTIKLHSFDAVQLDIPGNYGDRCMAIAEKISVRTRLEAKRIRETMPNSTASRQDN